jgi:hypothetical protein
MVEEKEMGNSILQDRSGSNWPLGFVEVVTPGVPVRLTVNVDPNNNDAPETPTAPGGVAGMRPTPTCNQIILHGYKPTGQGGHGLIPNTGRVYILRKPTAAGSGNYDDMGVIVGVIEPGGGAYSLPPSGGMPLTSLSPYQFYLDADVAGEGAIPVCWGVAG